MVSGDAFDNSFLIKLKRAGYSTTFMVKHHTKIVDRGNFPLKKNIDLQNDRKEQVNLAQNPKYAEVLTAHRKRCQELVTELSK